MAERQRGKYFLDRRNFFGSPQPKKQTTEPQKLESEKDKEIEHKLENLYNSLGTSFWDDQPKIRHQKKQKSPKNRGTKFTKVAKNTLANSKTKHRQLTATTRRAVTFYGFSAILVLVLGVVYLGRPEQKTGTISTVKAANTINASNAGYSPLLPKPADKLDNARSTLQYNAEKKVFTYDSSVGNGKYILISQQPLPQEYLKDPISGLGAIASNIGATDWQASSKGKIYLAPNENGNGQTAVFVYKNVLVLMRSTVNVSQEQWKNFADQLE